MEVSMSMGSVDENTQVAMEIVSQGAKLSGEVILKVIQGLSDLFENKGANQDFSINNKTLEGKQKIKDLIKKHNGGVMTLDENVTKEQVKEYQKEFKKMGVDFSVKKNGKDSYSFFFASKQANVIEKSLKNMLENRNRIELNNQKTKQANNSRESIENNRSRVKSNVKQKSSNVYSLDAVRKIDTKLKAQDKDKNKDNKRTQSLSR